MSTLTLNPPETFHLDTRSAQKQRIEALAKRLSTVHKDMEIGLEVCAAFDMAAEFAACEGISIGQAVQSFFDEADPEGTRWGNAQLALRKMLGWNESGRKLDSILLPIVPSAAFKLLRTDEERTSVADLESVAGADPVMAARLLSVANSARFASRYPVAVLRDAIQRMGIPEARKTLIAACFSGLFISPALQEVWAHSQLVADLSWQFARLCGEDPGLGYTAGLLHDIGRLALLSTPAARTSATAKWLDAGFPLVYAETLGHARDHAAAGTELLKSWDLPADLTEAVNLHHRPECTGNPLAHIVFLAEDLACLMEKTAAEDFWCPLRRQICLDRIGIPRDARAEIMSAFSELVC